MSGNLGGIGLNPMTAIRAPNDQPDVGGGSVAERHRWAVGRLHNGSTSGARMTLD